MSRVSEAGECMNRNSQEKKKEEDRNSCYSIKEINYVLWWVKDNGDNESNCDIKIYNLCPLISVSTVGLLACLLVC